MATTRVYDTAKMEYRKTPSKKEKRIWKAAIYGKLIREPKK